MTRTHGLMGTAASSKKAPDQPTGGAAAASAAATASDTPLSTMQLPFSTFTMDKADKIVDGIPESARIILLGESTHGTEEFYRTRAAITQRLVESRNFKAVCFEKMEVSRYYLNTQFGRDANKLLHRFVATRRQVPSQ